MANRRKPGEIREMDAEVDRVLRDWAWAFGLNISGTSLPQVFDRGKPVEVGTGNTIALLSSGLRATLHSGDYMLVKREPDDPA